MGLRKRVLSAAAFQMHNSPSWSYRMIRIKYAPSYSYARCKENTYRKNVNV
jgi:hypothetical protein